MEVDGHEVGKVSLVVVQVVLPVHELEQEQLAMLSIMLVRWESQRWV